MQRPAFGGSLFYRDLSVIAEHVQHGVDASGVDAPAPPGRGDLQPVIIIGMHRSGTTMLTRMLEGLGLFVGWRKDDNWEAHLFRQLNDWLLTQCGGSWDHPEPIRFLIENRELLQLAQSHLREVIQSPRALSYVGLHGFPWKRGVAPTSSWGWKDPRNTFTLPVWLGLFPGAKIIHVRRHGIDVANSLVRRGMKSLQERKQRYERHRLLYVFRGRRGGFVESPRCCTSEGALSLWREYVLEAQHHVESLGNRAEEVRYENFLTDPVGVLLNLVQFVGLDVTQSDVERVAGAVRPDRAFAYRRTPELRDLASRNEHQLAVCGYTP